MWVLFSLNMYSRCSWLLSYHNEGFSTVQLCCWYQAHDPNELIFGIIGIISVSRLQLPSAPYICTVNCLWWILINYAYLWRLSARGSDKPTSPPPALFVLIIFVFSLHVYWQYFVCIVLWTETSEHKRKHQTMPQTRGIPALWRQAQLCCVNFYQLARYRTLNPFNVGIR